MSEDSADDQDCLVCGASNPSGHVMVWPDEAQRGEWSVGRVCSSHKLFEIIAHPSDGFDVTIRRVDFEGAEVRALRAIVEADDAVAHGEAIIAARKLLGLDADVDGEGIEPSRESPSGP